MVTDLDARRDIVKKKRRCYRCLRGGHVAKFCRSNVRCYKCKVVGNHHTVFCRGDVKGKDKQSQENVIDGQEEITTSSIVNEKKSVLLQTAVCNLIGNNDRTEAVKALFDCGSQQTYIANRLVKPLNLKPVRDINFWSNHEESR